MSDEVITWLRIMAVQDLRSVQSSVDSMESKNQTHKRPSLQFGDLLIAAFCFCIFAVLVLNFLVKGTYRVLFVKSKKR